MSTSSFTALNLGELQIFRIYDLDFIAKIRTLTFILTLIFNLFRLKIRFFRGLKIAILKILNFPIFFSFQIISAL